MTRTHDQAPGIRRIIDRGPAGDGLADVLSPELVLVDPVAAAAARAALPERPWDLALDAARRRPDVPVEQVSVLVEPSVAGEAAVPSRTVRGPDRRRQRPVGVGAVRRLAWMSAWAAMVTGLALVAEVHAPNAPALGAPEQPAVPAPRSEPMPVRGAGYTIGPRSGFRVGAQGKVIGAFTLPVPCVAGVELPRLPVGPNSSFSFDGTIRWHGGRTVRVWMHGRFTSQTEAAGAVTVRGAGCPRHPVTFVARIGQ
jgi:hypothetical protein